MKNFLLAVITLTLLFVAFTLFDQSQETPEEYRERVAMEEQANFMQGLQEQGAAMVEQETERWEKVRREAEKAGR
jgi:hypothetical protein